MEAKRSNVQKPLEPHPEEQLMDVHQLRSRWKPIKEGLAKQQRNHPTAIRFHRACSWLKRVEDMGQEDHDLKLMCQ